jgi:hypothetical protein
MVKQNRAENRDEFIPGHLVYLPVAEGFSI